MDSVKAEIRPSLKRNKFGGSESSLNTDISRCYTKPLKPYLRKSAVDDFNRLVFIFDNYELCLDLYGFSLCFKNFKEL